MNEKNVKWDKVFYGKSWINHVVDTIRTKDILQSFYFKRYLLRAIMAGFILGVITVFVLLIKASLDTHVPTGVINLVAAVAFSFALVLILFTNSELLTSNFMYFTVGLYYRVISPTRVLKIFMLCFIGNALGGLVFFLILKGSDVMTVDMFTQLEATIEHKTLSSSLIAILIKGIFANFFINISLVIAMQIDDILAKMFVMMFGVSIFAFMGYEHVVYNTVLFAGGLIYHSNVLALTPAVINLIGAGIGNYIGGGLIIGLFYAYLNDHHQYDYKVSTKPVKH
ncbi:formate/nitrite transporter family protein [Staphylococcus saprophyticus]|uniref:formate/nitrite transporter family protein n=1 Tax=Staphylococcus saprophyticus TaxID=29385 RepID=UPI00065923F5|nr:formate/nitrite transporter family protein [Staphylococcus saprophyticus]MDW4146706.1 formate/nitrite transporter family protein [Staphylococcus saprophyticus]RXS15053.1 formate/nitrite transporter [Staphylococcus saprophyticus]CRV28473.1 formate/nitrate transporter [Streptococcus equi subsp. equi]